MSATGARAPDPVIEPADCLRALAHRLREEGSVISAAVRDPAPQLEPTLGLLAASGPRSAEAPGEYALLFESVREGYLLHYGAPRLLADVDSDLALLAGDYLYALGLERLAALQDLEAVGELSDLISLSAQLNAERRGAEPLGALWLAAGTALACGAGPAHEGAKRDLRAGDPAATTSLASAASATAAEAGIVDVLAAASDSIDFPLDLHS